MSTAPTLAARVRPVSLPASFPAWRASLAARGVPAVIGIAGSRGKTTIARLVDMICREAGLRTALWTDQGIEIAGRKQRGELGPWARAMQGLTGNQIDLAIQELDWSLVNAVGLPANSYPVIGISNLCVNSDSCLIRTETLLAGRAITRIKAAVRTDGVIVLNGEDFSVADDAETARAAAVLVGLSRDTPLLRNHLRGGGGAVWLNADEMVFGGDGAALQSVGETTGLRFALRGAIGFQVHNALMAAAIARACGIDPVDIAAALSRFEVPALVMPGSFNMVRVAGAVAVVDRPAPSWFLRAPLRGLGHLRPGHRLITVAGAMSDVPEDDLVETGRLLGRAGGALIIHSQESENRLNLLRQGITSNEVPPVMIHLPTERKAINRMIRMVRPDDLVFVLADRPDLVLRTLERAANKTDPA